MRLMANGVRKLYFGGFPSRFYSAWLQLYSGPRQMLGIIRNALRPSSIPKTQTNFDSSAP
jgi:hypothetical protein